MADEVEEKTEQSEIFFDTPEDSPWDDSGPSNDGNDQLADEKVTDKDGKSSETKKDDKSKGEPDKATGVTKPEKDAGGKTIYTSEEVAELLKTGSNVDTSRLSAEGQLLMKSFQRGYDEKFKALADERRKSEPPPQSDAPRAKLFRRYVDNPAGVTGEINAEIEKLEGVEPGEQDYSNARRLIAQLHAMKDEFRENRSNISEGQKMKETIYIKADAAVRAAIPDWDAKESKLTEFALSLGLELDDIKVMTDPTIMGPRSVRFIKTINAVYDKMMAGMTAEKKVDKKAPNQLGRPGSPSSSSESTDEKPLEKMSYAEYKAHRMRGLNKN